MIKRTMAINKEKIYVCTGSSDNTIYSSPVMELAVVMPISVNGDVYNYGENYSEYAKLVDGNISHFSYIKENDRIYYKKTIPTTHDVSQTTESSANYFVSGTPMISKNLIEIKLKKIPNR